MCYGIKFEALENEIQKDGFNVAIGMGYVVLDAHMSFSQLLRNRGGRWCPR